MSSKDFLNGDLEINEYYDVQADIWNKKNQNFWGLTAHPQSNLDSPFLIRQTLIEDQDDFWNNGTCKLKEHLLDEKNKKFHGREFLVKDSWKLDYNTINRGIGLSALFLLSANNKALNSVKAQKLIDEINKLTKRQRESIIKKREYKGHKLSLCRVAVMPLVTSLGYVLKNSEYTLRIQASRNEYLIKKINGKVKYKNWVYKDGEFKSVKTGKVIATPFKTLNEAQYPLLSAALGDKKLTAKTFPEALDKLPEYDKDSVLYFNFR